MGAVSQVLAKHNVEVRRGRVDTHRDEGIVERFNRTLAERLFGHQYAQELLLTARGSSKRSDEWVARLPAVVATLNDEPTRLTGKKPSTAIRASKVAQKPPLLFQVGRLVLMSLCFHPQRLFAICTRRVS